MEEKEVVKYGREYAHMKKSDEGVINSGKCLGLRYQVDSERKRTELTYSHWAELSDNADITLRHMSKVLGGLWSPLNLWSATLIRGKLCLSEVYKLKRNVKEFYKEMKDKGVRGSDDGGDTLKWDTKLQDLVIPSSKLQEQLSDVLRKWKEFRKDLDSFRGVTVNRYMFEHVPEGLGRPIKIELFTFSDASGRVIGTCVYMRLTFQQLSLIHI